MADIALLDKNEPQSPEDVTVDNPLRTGERNERGETQEQQQTREDQEEEAALLQIRQTYKLSWMTKRQFLIRRVLRAFEYLKNNPYAVMNYGTNEMDPIMSVLSGATDASDPKLYQYNDNVYQMLCLSFIAALSPNVSKVRWMPDDPQNEEDLSFMKKASTMMAYIERKNDMPSLQNLMLLYLWCAGTYFRYVRNVVDSVRGGITKTPIYQMIEQEVFPERYLCPQCGSPNPLNQYSPFAKPACQDCNAPLGDKDYYPAESMPMPTQVGEDEQPLAFTAMDVFCVLNFDADPDAAELTQSPIGDLEGEMFVSSVRAMYPDKYSQLTQAAYGDETVNGSTARIAREAVSSPTAQRSILATDLKGTYSRCWIQNWAFNILDDEMVAKRLSQKYPKGVKLVSWGDVVLEKRPESLLEHWTECRTIKGIGLYPFGVGDVALSLQDRLDETANNIHAYQDRLACPPILANAMLIDADALSRQQWSGGRAVSVYPAKKNAGGQRFNLQDSLWQPDFHVDPKIYDYSQTIIMLMQLLTGVQPQIFGGGTNKGVDTFGGQQQMLNTAMGRLMLFLQQCRSENAIASKLAVKCMAADIDDQKRITIEGEIEGEYENEYIFQSDVQGEIHAYPMADQGFPASYGEMRDRLIQILGMVEKNPVLQNMLSDPDMQKLMAIYLLPDGAKLPGDSQRTKIKMVMQKLANDKPTVTNGMVMPSIQPDPDVDDMSEIVMLAKDWMSKNYQLADTNPMGYANVRAYLKLAAQNQAVGQAKQAAVMAATQGGGAAQPAPPAAA